MPRIALISWLVILSAMTGGAVLAAERMVKPCTAVAVPRAKLASLQPVEEYPLGAGRIVAIDAKDGRLTIMQRGIPHFYLDPGTFIFHVDDRALLTGLTPGDKVRFDVTRTGKRFTITRLENSN